MVSDRKLTRYEKRIKSLQSRKLDEIDKFYPIEAINYHQMIKSGLGRARSTSELRDMLKEGKTKYTSELQLYEVFDLSGPVDKIKESNAINEERRKAAKAKLEAETTELLDKAYFAGEAELLESLKSFGTKRFKA